MQNGKVTESGMKMFKILEQMFGKDIYEQTTCIITHAENPITTKEYLELNRKDAVLMEALNKFKKESILLGTLYTDKDDETDEHIKRKKRIPFLQSLQKDLESITGLNKMHMRIFDFQSFLLNLKEVFVGRHTYKDSLVKLDKLSRLKVVVDDCPICLELVLNDIFITSCGHTYHYDCLSIWVATQTEKAIAATCPLCRGKYFEFIRLEGDSSVNSPNAKKK